MMAQIQGCAKVGKKLQWGRNISIPLPFFYLKRIEKTKVVTGKYQIQLVDVVRLSFRRRGRLSGCRTPQQLLFIQVPSFPLILPRNEWWRSIVQQIVLSRTLIPTLMSSAGLNSTKTSLS